MTEERRASPRTSLLLVTELDSGQPPGAVGVIVDISTSGARLLTGARVTVKDRVDLTLHIGAEGSTHEIGAEVVRVEALPLEQRGVWTHTIAVRFEQALSGYDEELARLAENAAKLGL